MGWFQVYVASQPKRLKVVTAANSTDTDIALRKEVVDGGWDFYVCMRANEDAFEIWGYLTGDDVRALQRTPPRRLSDGSIEWCKPLTELRPIEDLNAKLDKGEGRVIF